MARARRKETKANANRNYIASILTEEELCDAIAK
jgi:hypothetical protein